MRNETCLVLPRWDLFVSILASVIVCSSYTFVVNLHFMSVTPLQISPGPLQISPAPLQISPAPLQISPAPLQGIL